MAPMSRHTRIGDPIIKLLHRCIRQSAKGCGNKPIHLQLSGHLQNYTLNFRGRLRWTPKLLKLLYLPFMNVFQSTGTVVSHLEYGPLDTIHYVYF